VPKRVPVARVPFVRRESVSAKPRSSRPEDAAFALQASAPPIRPVAQVQACRYGGFKRGRGSGKTQRSTRKSSSLCASAGAALLTSLSKKHHTSRPSPCHLPIDCAQSASASLE